MQPNLCFPILNTTVCGRHAVCIFLCICSVYKELYGFSVCILEFLLLYFNIEYLSVNILMLYSINFSITPSSQKPWVVLFLFLVV